MPTVRSNPVKLNNAPHSNLGRDGRRRQTRTAQPRAVSSCGGTNDVVKRCRSIPTRLVVLLFAIVVGLFSVGSTVMPPVGARAEAPTSNNQQGEGAQSGDAQADASQADLPRLGFMVDVPLPLVGDRDAQVRQQIERIHQSASNQNQRPIVVLRFQSTAVTEIGEPDNGGMGTRGSQFERCLALARFLTSPEAARVRLIAYVSDTVQGHAVLPVLACEEIYAAQETELGQAAIDEPLDATIEGAYRDVVSRRASLPQPVVMAMLDPTSEVYQLELSDGSSKTVDRQAADELREEGLVVREETIWPGGGLASFPAAQLRARRWISRTVTDASQLTEALGITGSLRDVQQIPRDWQAVTISISGVLNAGRVSQIMRAVDDAITNDDVNLIVVRVEEASTKFRDASRLAGFVAELDDDIYTIGIIAQSIRGPLALPAIACKEVVLLTEASLAPPESRTDKVTAGRSVQRVLGDLAWEGNRPPSLMTALCDSEVEVKEYIHQGSGRKAIYADWQLESLDDNNQWLARAKVAGDGEIDPEIALRYRLIDSIDDNASQALQRLGIDEQPEELATPWLDASIQMLLAQPWVSRILLTIGFFALMAELGNPGIGIGGLISGVCFLGFFWIEGLNGNVAWLEILLFVAGLVALAVELFVLPGFGLFGISGLLMLFVSIVLASQTFVWPTTSAELNEVAANLFWVACLALCGMIGLVFMHHRLEQLPFLRWVKLEPGGTDNLADIDIRESFAHHEHLLGQEGLTTTRLNPSGKAQFGREIVQVIGSGQLIDAGVLVRVIEVRGSLIIVEAVE